MTRVLILTSDALPGHEKRNLPLVREMLSKGYDVLHTGPEAAMTAEGLKRTVFPEGFESDAEAKACHTQLFRSWADLARLVRWSDVVLLSVMKDYREFVSLCKALGKVVIQHRDSGECGSFIWDPDLLLVRSLWDEERDRRMSLLPSDRVSVVGCVQYDAASPSTRRMTREAFCGKYGIDPTKKIVTYLPPSASLHTPQTKVTYARICRQIMALPGFALIIKPHPREYDRAKYSLQYEDVETASWKQIVPEATACDAEDKYDCFFHSDVLVSSITCTVFEAALLHRPVLCVDIPETVVSWVSNDEQVTTGMFPNPRFSPPSRRLLSPLGVMHDRINAIPEGSLKRMLLSVKKHSETEFPVRPLEYIGAEVACEELGGVLSSGAYRCDDPDVYKQYIREFCLCNDGKAYWRAADAVDTFLRQARVQKRIQDARRMRHWLQAKYRIRTWRRHVKRALAGPPTSAGGGHLKSMRGDK